jgi:hypothetical protein
VLTQQREEPVAVLDPRVRLDERSDERLTVVSACAGRKITWCWPTPMATSSVC